MRWRCWMVLLWTAQIAGAQLQQSESDPEASRRPPKVYTSGMTPGDKMQPGDILLVGAFMTSPSGQFKLVMQADCNLVLYQVTKDPATGAEVSQEGIWATSTERKGTNCLFRVLERGQLVVQSMNNSRVRWHSSDTYFADPIPPFQFLLHDDGNLLVLFETPFDPAPYTVLWQAGSHGK